MRLFDGGTYKGSHMVNVCSFERSGYHESVNSQHGKWEGGILALGGAKDEWPLCDMSILSIGSGCRKGLDTSCYVPQAW